MKWLRRTMVALLLLAVALSAITFFFVRRSFPPVQGEIRVHGLDHPVEIIRDVDGVPHVFASTNHDLFFAQGYVHAQDRFWQMDFWRHIGSGRLAEMFGESQLDTDMFLRSLDFVGLSESELESMAPKVRTILEAYSEGVNAYLAERAPTQVSLEYGILALQGSGYEIEPWTPINTLTWAKVMSWDLSWNLYQEIDRAMISARLPVERVEQTYPPYPEEHPVVVPSDQAAMTRAEITATAPGALTALEKAGARAGVVWDLTGGGFAGIGSNNWVIGGSRTKSGLPILANDPHLAIQMPSIWYVNGLHCLEMTADCPFQLAGFSFPGTPGVIIGHNDHIAWGLTNQAVDTQDLFIEKVNPDDATQYEFEGEWIDMGVRSETIEIAGGEPVTYDVMTTHHGPVISDLYLEEGQLDGTSLELPDDYVVSLAWGTLEPSTLVEAFIGLNLSTNYEQFRTALSKWDIAAQNVVYADRDGNIAYQSTGRVPIRAGGDGRWPVPGWTGEFEWTGVVPYEEMPRMVNPPRDYIASANQPVISPGKHPFLSGDWDLGYRAARIEDLIAEASGAYTVTSAQEMQMDDHDGGAPNVVPHLLAVSRDSEPIGVMQDALEPWSTGRDAFRASPGSPGAAAYEATWVNLLRLTFHDELPEESWPEGGSRWFELVGSLLESPDDPWWDDVSTEIVEDRDTILARAMTDAHAELVERLGSDPTTWQWGSIHLAPFEHQSLGQSGIGPIEWLFNRTAPPRLGGGADIVNAVGFYPPDGYQVDWIPSMRMVIDLADLSRSTAINSTGQSGHAFHGHYKDMIEPWVDGKQHPLRWTRDQVVADAAATLELTPQS